jgi:hypothetical protein
MKILAVFISIAFLSGCAANAVRLEASSVEIVNEVPNKDRCKFLGEIYGSQDNWFTGDLTSNKNLVIGARNELRNEAHALGGNVVYIQDMKIRMHGALWGQQIPRPLAKPILANNAA